MTKYWAANGPVMNVARFTVMLPKVFTNANSGNSGGQNEIYQSNSMGLAIADLS